MRSLDVRVLAGQQLFYRQRQFFFQRIFVCLLGSVLTLDQLADGRWKALTQIHRRVMIKDFVGEADGYVADVEVLDERPALEHSALNLTHSHRGRSSFGIPGARSRR